MFAYIILAIYGGLMQKISLHAFTANKRFNTTFYLLCIIYLCAVNIKLPYYDSTDLVRYIKEPIYFMLIVWVAIKYAQGKFKIPLNKGAYIIAMFLYIPFLVTSVYMNGFNQIYFVYRSYIAPVIILVILLNSWSLTLADRERLAFFSQIILWLIAITALVHYAIDEEFLINKNFVSRYTLDAAYSSFSKYESVSRYRSIFGDPNIAAVLCIALFSIATTSRYIDNIKYFKLAFIALLLVFATESRLGLLAIGLHIYFDRAKEGRINLINILLPVLLFILILGLWFNSATRAEAVTIVGRFAIWVEALNYFSSNSMAWIFGLGNDWIGQKGTIFSEFELMVYDADGAIKGVSYIDNSFITIITSMGLLGGVYYIYFYMRHLYRLYLMSEDKMRCKGLLIIYGAYGFMFDMIVSFPWYFLFPYLISYSARVKMK